MKTTEQRLEELETVAHALTVLVTVGFVSSLQNGAVPVMRKLANEAPGLTDEVRVLLHRIADAAEAGLK